MDNTNNFLSNYPMEIIVIDYSSYIIFMALFLVSIYSIWLMINKKSVKVEKTKKQIVLEKIHSLDFESVEHKKLAYEFTILVRDYLEEKNETFYAITQELEIYKYHDKEIQIDTKTLLKMKRFIDELE